MFTAGHVVISSKNAEADRAFFRDVLGFSSVDAGDGWLIFALPPSETAFHPSDKNDIHECQVAFGDRLETSWGIPTTVQSPGGGELGLYEPRHSMAVSAP